VFDRLVTNVFPRQSFKIKNGYSLVTGGFTGYSTSKDRVDGFLGDGGAGGPFFWSALLFDVLARVSGRMSICATDLCFFTMMKTFHGFVADHAPSWLDVHEMEEDRRRLHIQAGIQICVFTLPHVWSCLLPCLQGFDLQFEAGQFELPMTERVSFPTVNVVDRVVKLEVDDVWRLVEMTILLGLLAPLSYFLFARRWSAAIKIHGFVAIMYFWDIVRRHSHPHSWIFNGPVFFLWMLDRFMGNYSRRRDGTATVVPLGDQYVAVLLRHAGSRRLHRLAAPLWYLKLASHGTFFRAHPFTACQNRSGRPWKLKTCSDVADHAFLVLKGAGSDELLLGAKASIPDSQMLEDGVRYDWMWIIQVSSRLGAFTPMLLGKHQDVRPDPSDNHRFHIRTADLQGFGPYASPYQRMIDCLDIAEHPLLVIASGSGAALVLEALDSLTSCHGGFDVTVVYTTKDLHVFQFVTDMMQQRIMAMLPTLSPKRRLKVKVALTGNPTVRAGRSFNPMEPVDSGLHLVTAIIGRIDFEEEVQNSPEGAHVFFCGAPLLQKLLRESCKKYNREIHSSHSFGGPSTVELNQNLADAIQEGLVNPDLIQREAEHVALGERNLPRGFVPAPLSSQGSQYGSPQASPQASPCGKDSQVLRPSFHSSTSPQVSPCGKDSQVMRATFHSGMSNASVHSSLLYDM